MPSAQPIGYPYYAHQMPWRTDAARSEIDALTGPACTVPDDVRIARLAEMAAAAIEALDDATDQLAASVWPFGA